MSVDTVAAALEEASATNAQFIAGGTAIVDLMTLDVQTPDVLVDINALPLTDVAVRPDGGLEIGALVRNADLARHPLIQQTHTALAEAARSGASPQIRNMASLGGNLLQWPRCTYFRDRSYPCNLRAPGSGCSAIGGVTRGHAVLGASEQCIAVHPSDIAVALLALDAVIVTREPGGGERRIAAADFFVAYGARPGVRSALAAGELITTIAVPPSTPTTRSTYLKARSRASFEFARASVAVSLDLADGVMTDVRVALGGIATKPWRAYEAEALLVQQPPSPTTFRQVGEAALVQARPQGDNADKVELAVRAIVRALAHVTDSAPAT